MLRIFCEAPKSPPLRKVKEELQVEFQQADPSHAPSVFINLANIKSESLSDSDEDSKPGITGSFSSGDVGNIEDLQTSPVCMNKPVNIIAKNNDGLEMPVLEAIRFDTVADVSINSDALIITEEPAITEAPIVSEDPAITECLGDHQTGGKSISEAASNHPPCNGPTVMENRENVSSKQPTKPIRTSRKRKRNSNGNKQTSVQQVIKKNEPAKAKQTPKSANNKKTPKRKSVRSVKQSKTVGTEQMSSPKKRVFVEGLKSEVIDELLFEPVMKSPNSVQLSPQINIEPIVANVRGSDITGNHFILSNVAAKTNESNLPCVIQPMDIKVELKSSPKHILPSSEDTETNTPTLGDLVSSASEEMQAQISKEKTPTSENVVISSSENFQSVEQPSELPKKVLDILMELNSSVQNAKEAPSDHTENNQAESTIQNKTTAHRNIWNPGFPMTSPSNVLRLSIPPIHHSTPRAQHSENQKLIQKINQQQKEYFQQLHFNQTHHNRLIVQQIHAQSHHLGPAEAEVFAQAHAHAQTQVQLQSELFLANSLQHPFHDQTDVLNSTDPYADSSSFHNHQTVVSTLNRTFAAPPSIPFPDSVPKLFPVKKARVLENIPVSSIASMQRPRMNVRQSTNAVPLNRVRTNAVYPMPSQSHCVGYPVSAPITTLPANIVQSQQNSNFAGSVGGSRQQMEMRQIGGFNQPRNNQGNLFLPPLYSQVPHNAQPASLGIHNTQQAVSQRHIQSNIQNALSKSVSNSQVQYQTPPQMAHMFPPKQALAETQAHVVELERAMQAASEQLKNERKKLKMLEKIEEQSLKRQHQQQQQELRMIREHQFQLQQEQQGIQQLHHPRMAISTTELKKVHQISSINSNFGMINPQISANYVRLFDASMMPVQMPIPPAEPHFNFTSASATAVVNPTSDLTLNQIVGPPVNFYHSS